MSKAQEQKEFMAASAHFTTPGCKQEQQEVYEELLRLEKGEPIRSAEHRSTTSQLPRITMEDLDAREERLAAKRAQHGGGDDI